jgi:hypothetical protein
MDKEKVKLIIRNMESLIDCLKMEVYSSTQSHSDSQNWSEEALHDYDEIFEDEPD